MTHNKNASSSNVSLTSGWLLLLGALTGLAPLSIDMYLPGFPEIEKSLLAHAGSAELTLASYFIGLAIGQLFYGPLSDRFGRRLPLMVGLVIYIAASIGCAFTGSIHELIAWRFLQALGGCAGMVVTMAIIRDRCNANDTARALSMLMLVMGLAPIIAPLVGGWIVTVFDWRVLFLTLAVAGSAGLIAVYFQLEETHDTRHEPPLVLTHVLRNYSRLLTDRSFLGYTLSGGLARAGMFAYIAGSPFVFIEYYQIPTQHYGWIFAANAAGLILFSQINAWRLKQHDATVLLSRALWLPGGIGLILLGLSLSGHITLPLLLLGIFGFVASIGYIGPNSSAATLATHGQQAGTASALMGSLQFCLATLAGGSVNMLHDGTTFPMAMVMAGCGMGALLIHRLIIKRPLSQRK
ncbi:MFS transporter, DHA1 family, bicyclomycin/chloramphenicol resistance protein [Methylobacillus rhizosphaerae]|uniref:Bcr/CflA family efflux transporter n=1 Tax=Methylobacillus rhizosphaerae TaxID=551994 RepID=A0A239AHV7_9PROT|nr:Bcr/CflA family multidrug efflux MFS transporter [Methylobacillus rhizosphaerae]SNR94533.1 MFS transporter, DHA1 family, bicyclomycin/chloramphenicol resistance protein [Methylobacillus rhizosphaerae]